MGRTDAQILECPLDRLSGLVIKSAGIRLGSNLNSGGWGTVYLGRLAAPIHSPTHSHPSSPESKIKRFVHRSLFRPAARLFAVKVLQTAHSGRDKEMQDEEARLHLLASSSHHPGIVKLHQVIKEPKFTFLVLDYCPGGDLFGAIMTKRFYGDIPAIKSIIIQLAEALQFLHSISIFHRDLKPENVLITSQRGEPPRVAIADFGLSSDVPMASIELGSIHYMSPECLGRYGKYYPEYSCAATDVWALGVVILALVLDRVLPWSKAVDDCEAFREFSFDTHRWFMRRWNLSEPFNALLVHIFELNPYRRIAASSIPQKVKKINYFVTTPRKAQLALQRYSDAAAEHQRCQELAFLEGRYDRVDVFPARGLSPKAAQGSPPGDAILRHTGTVSRVECVNPPLPRSQDALGLSGMTTTADVDSLTPYPYVLPADEDERLMQEALIAAHRLEDTGADVVTTVFPSARLRSLSFVRRPSPLRSALSLDSKSDEAEGTSHLDNHEAFVSSNFDDIEISNAPPLVDDDDSDEAEGDGLNSNDMPSTPRNRLASIPELQGAAGVVESSTTPETRLPRLHPLTVLGGLGMETIHSQATKPPALLAKAIQPHKMRRGAVLNSCETPLDAPKDTPHVPNNSLATLRIQTNEMKDGTAQHQGAAAVTVA